MVSRIWFLCIFISGVHSPAWLQVLHWLLNDIGFFRKDLALTWDYKSLTKSFVSGPHICCQKIINAPGIPISQGHLKLLSGKQSILYYHPPPSPPRLFLLLKNAWWLQPGRDCTPSQTHTLDNVEPNCMSWGCNASPACTGRTCALHTRSGDEIWAPSPGDVKQES